MATNIPSRIQKDNVIKKTAQEVYLIKYLSDQSCKTSLHNFISVPTQLEVQSIMLSRTLFSFSFGFSFLSLPFTTANEWKKSDGCYKLQDETFLADATEVDDSNVKSVLFSTFFDTIQEDPKIKHELFLPPNYNPENAYPVMFHFHGYGGSYHECGSTCVKAAEERGFVVVSMTGFGKLLLTCFKVQFF